MSIIIRSAYLKVEEGIIAHIVYRDGNRSQDLVTKRQALEIAEGLQGISLSDEEFLAIREQIHASPLLNKNKRLEEFSNQVQGQSSEIKRKIEEIIEQHRRDDDAGEEWKFQK